MIRRPGGAVVLGQAAAGAKPATADVAGLGAIVVDGNGMPVYLSSGGNGNGY